MLRDQALRVLLIDDSDADAFLVEEALREAGLDFELERFEDGADALVALRSRSGAPHVVLLDLEMPRSDGAQVLLELRAIPGLERTPIALFTSELPPGFKNAPTSLVRCVKKPLYLDDFLTTVVSTVLDLARDAQARRREQQPTRRR